MTFEQKNEVTFLAEGIEYIVIETDEDDPEIAAVIDNDVTPGSGYRIRIKYESSPIETPALLGSSD